jgi:hypothetical protein
MSVLYNVVPYNFFQIFSTKSRVAYSDILFLFYNRGEEENSYSFNKEEFISIIENYFEEHSEVDLEDEERQVKTPREKANLVFRTLKKFGWIDTEYVTNGEQIVNLEDYAIAFLSTYAHFDSGKDIELSSYVYRIYKNLIRFDLDRTYFILRDTLDQCNSLLRKLKTLNSNIKKYIKKLVDHKGDEYEQLNYILKQLLDDYKIKIIDNAYYYMKTNDNPSKYRSSFKSNCDNIRNNLLSSTVLQIMKEENVDEIEATKIFNELIDNLHYSFDKIVDVISEIDIKNAKYINVAIERIRILMSNDVNFEGQLIHILKNLNCLRDEELTFEFPDVKNIIDSSLYTPRNVIKVNSSPVVKNVKISDKEFEEIKRILDFSKQFSQDSICNYIGELLDNKKRVTIDDFDVKDNVNFAKLILIFVYADLNKDKYKVVWQKENRIVDNVKIPGFFIESGDRSE